MSAGLLGLGRGDWPRRALLPDGPLGARRAWPTWSAAVVARDLYRRGYSRVQGGRSSRQAVGLVLVLDAVFHRLFFFLPRPIRLLILKDLRTFRRDPAQWSQFLIFFGLLAFYFLNIRRLGYDVQSPYWRNLVSFLNLVGDGPDPVDLHQPVHLPAALAGGPELLGPGPAAAAAASRSSGASSRSRRASRWWRPRSWSSSAT